jgi:hypothetical protein
MQFKYPEILYALFLLLIPIIIHLFQFRKFQKEAFTNVAFLKEVSIQTRKSSQLKKWLALLARLFLLAAIIFAFTQPFLSKSSEFKTKGHSIIYLDNSFSMQANGSQGELLQRAIQDIITNVPDNESFTLITNDKTYNNTTIKGVKNDLLTINYSSKSLSYDAVFLKCKNFLKSSSGINNLIFISDFQQKNGDFNPKKDTLINMSAVKLKPVSVNNISIDSAYIINTSADKIELQVVLKNTGNSIDNVPISLFNNNQLIAKTSVSLDKEIKTSFSLPINEVINGKITIEDTHLQFDNSLFFTINETPKLNVLSINEEDDSFLRKIYTDKEFNYNASLLNQLDYNIINDQNLIVLNELKQIPISLVGALKAFTQQGGYIIIIPSEDMGLNSYNALLLNYENSFNPITNSEKQVMKINYEHPLFKNDVFEKRVTNFQYPKINSFYSYKNIPKSQILNYEDGQAFLFQNKNTYIFTAPLNINNSNFKNSPLIVPTLYNIAKFSFKIPALYYTIGNENSFDISVNLHQDDILSLVSNDINFIPKQQYYNNKVVITTDENPILANIYSVNDKNESLQNISYNYNRNESNLTYQDIESISHVTVSNSVSDIFNIIKSETKVNELWKWFAIFALAFLIIEMLILKYFK